MITVHQAVLTKKHFSREKRKISKMNKIVILMILILGSIFVASGQETKQHLPEVCGLKPILKAKCSPDKSDDDCHACILPFLKVSISPTIFAQFICTKILKDRCKLAEYRKYSRIQKCKSRNFGQIWGHFFQFGLYSGHYSVQYNT